MIEGNRFDGYVHFRKRNEIGNYFADKVHEEAPRMQPQQILQTHDDGWCRFVCSKPLS